ncbi:MAG TPA: carboxylesterase/lipase family protein [Candidatus Binatia bacterium]
MRAISVPNRTAPARTRGAHLALCALLLTAACSDRSASSSIQQGTLLRIGDGWVQGEIVGGTRRFLGIPFAAPPVGELRWRPPAPVVPWEGTLDARAFGSACPQRPSTLGTPSENEDCLYLNVWTPEPAPNEPLPVMVWFHGGGNEFGSAGDEVPLGLGGLIFDGQLLSERRNVVVVTINYRLGKLGFFAHPALASEDPSHPYAGNQGLLDQRAALEWVRDEILAFGGDPENVTIFGESAGSVDVCLQVASPGSRGLFHRAISESGGCTTRQDTAEEGAALAERIAEVVGCGDAADQLACLRAAPVGALLDSGVDVGPTVDGGFLPDQPRALFDRGEVARVPYILGSNADEGTIFFLGVPPVTSEAEYLEALRERYGERAEEIARVYPASSFPTPQDALVRVVGDSGLVCGTYDSARRAAAAGLPVYLYNFARWVQIPELVPLDLRALHGAEIAYVFGSPPPPTPEDAALVDAIQGYWTRLARDGDPNGDGAIVWPTYDDATDERLNLDAEITVVQGFRRRECEYWWSVYDAAFE